MTDHIEKNENTEEKIRQVAKRLFTERGFTGTKIRDVAEEAGVNIALMNYYFRSKEKLYESILAENFEEYADAINDTLNAANLSLEERIRQFVSQLIDHLKLTPDLPFFIINEFRNNSQFCKQIASNKWEKFGESALAKQLEEDSAQGKIRKIDLRQFEHMITSPIIMSFLGIPFLEHMGGLNEEDFLRFVDNQKQIIPDMLMAYLKIS